MKLSVFRGTRAAESISLTFALDSCDRIRLWNVLRGIGFVAKLISDSSVAVCGEGADDSVASAIDAASTTLPLAMCSTMYPNNVSDPLSVCEGGTDRLVVFESPCALELHLCGKRSLPRLRRNTSEQALNISPHYRTSKMSTHDQYPPDEARLQTAIF